MLTRRYFVRKSEYLAEHGVANDPETGRFVAINAAGASSPLVGLQRLDEDAGKYFNLDYPGTRMVDIGKLRTTKFQPKSIAVAMSRMREASAGGLAKRNPIAVRREPDGMYSVLDGNATTGAARASGWWKIPVVEEEPALKADKSVMVLGSAADLRDPDEVGRFLEALLGRPLTDRERRHLRRELRKSEYLAAHNVENSPEDGRFVAAGVSVDPSEVQGLVSRINTEGGFTYRVGTKSAPKTGAVVSPYPKRERVFYVDSFSKEPVKHLMGYIRDNIDALKDPGHYLGGWFDREAGKIYLDTVIVTNSREKAAKLAAQHNQEGYFDLDSKETVIVKPPDERRKIARWLAGLGFGGLAARYLKSEYLESRNVMNSPEDGRFVRADGGEAYSGGAYESAVLMGELSDDEVSNEELRKFLKKEFARLPLYPPDKMDLKALFSGSASEGMRIVAEERAVAKVSEKAIENVRVAEKTIGDLLPRGVEECYAFDPKTGEQIFYKLGGRGEVSFTDPEMEALRDSVFTHNHPNGTSFSFSDIMAASKMGAAEIRAVGHENTYSIKPREGKSWLDVVSVVFAQHPSGGLTTSPQVDDIESVIRGTFQAEILDDRLPVDRANILHQHLVFEALESFHPNIIDYSAEPSHPDRMKKALQIAASKEERETEEKPESKWRDRENTIDYEPLPYGPEDAKKSEYLAAHNVTNSPEDGKFVRSDAGEDLALSRQPFSEAVGEWKLPDGIEGDDEAMMAYSDQHRAKENRWEMAVRRELSRGRLSPEEAHALGYRFVNHEQDPSFMARPGSSTWEKLPPTLYHITTASDAVLATGLKTREELQMVGGRGLGGGQDDTISFTDDLAVAEGIHATMLDAHDYATGVKGPLDMLAEAATWRGSSKGEALEREFLAQYERDKGNEIAAGIARREFNIPVPGNSLYFPKDGGSFKAINPDSRGWATTWERSLTAEEKRDRTFDLYKNFLWRAESAGSRFNPVFFATDVAAFAAVPKEQIRLLAAEPREGAQGFRMRGMGEIRTYTGDAIQRVSVLKGAVLKSEYLESRNVTNSPEDGRFIRADISGGGGLMSDPANGPTGPAASMIASKPDPYTHPRIRALRNADPVVIRDAADQLAGYDMRARYADEPPGVGTRNFYYNTATEAAKSAFGDDEMAAQARWFATAWVQGGYDSAVSDRAEKVVDGEAITEKELTSSTVAAYTDLALRLVTEAPEVDAPLYRGMALTPEDAKTLLKPGAVIQDAVASFTSRRDVADVFTTIQHDYRTGSVPVILVGRGIRGAHISPLAEPEPGSELHATAGEFLAGGKFEIERVREADIPSRRLRMRDREKGASWDAPYQQPREGLAMTGYVVEIRQIATPDYRPPKTEKKAEKAVRLPSYVPHGLWGQVKPTKRKGFFAILKGYLTEHGVTNSPEDGKFIALEGAGFRTDPLSPEQQAEVAGSAAAHSNSLQSELQSLKPQDEREVRYQTAGKISARVSDRYRADGKFRAELDRAWKNETQKGREDLTRLLSSGPLAEDLRGRLQDGSLYGSALSGLPEDLRDGIVGRLSEAYAAGVMVNWEESPVDSKTMVAAQRWAGELVGADPESYSAGLRSSMESLVPSKSTIAGVLQPAVLAGMYAETQEELKSRGIDFLTVYRGVKFTSDQDAAKFGLSGLGRRAGDSVVTEISANPLSSWTVSRDTALHFAGVESTPDSYDVVVLSSVVPARNVFSLPTTGAGMAWENEVVLIGSDGISAKAERVKDLNTIWRSEARGTTRLRVDDLDPNWLRARRKGFSSVLKDYLREHNVTNSPEDGRFIALDAVGSPTLESLNEGRHLSVVEQADRAGPAAQHSEQLTEDMKGKSPREMKIEANTKVSGRVELMFREDAEFRAEVEKVWEGLSERKRVEIGNRVFEASTSQSFYEPESFIADFRKAMNFSELPQDAQTMLVRSMSESATRQVIDGWANSAATGTSLWVQTHAADILGVTNAMEYVFGAPVNRRDLDEAISGLDASFMRASVRAMYAETQDDLKARGIDFLTVYRGVTLHSYEDSRSFGVEDLSRERGASTVTTILANPLSSWAVSREIANQFAGGLDAALNTGRSVPYDALVISAVVPARNVFSTPFTGNGCLNEYETVLIGVDGIEASVERVLAEGRD